MLILKILRGVLVSFSGTTSEVIEQLETHGYFRGGTPSINEDEILKKDLENFPFYSGLDFTSKHVGINRDGERSSWYTIKARNVSKRRLQKHFDGEHTVALPVYPHSKYMIVDIDHRSQINPNITTTDILKELEKEFGNPIYYEYSRKTKGYHVYFHLKEYLEESGRLALQNEYLKRGYIIEVIGGSKKIRIPYSNTYKVAYDRNKMRIRDIHSLTENFRIAYEDKEKHYRVPIPTWLKEFNKNGEAIKKFRQSLGSPTKEYNRTYGYGTRHIEQIKIGFDTLREKKHFDDFVQACEYWNDGTSKDMQLPEIKKQRMLENIWNWCLQNYEDVPEYTVRDGILYDEYGNLVFLNSEEFQFSDKEYEKLEKIFTYYYRIYKYGKIGTKLEDTFISNAILLLEAIWSKSHYDKRTGAYYTQEQYSKLSNATLFNYKLKKLMCDQLGIKNHRRIWKFLEDTKAIKSVYIGKYDYSYKKERFAKHYKITRINFMYNNVNIRSNKSIYTSINNNKYNSKFTSTGHSNKKSLNYVVTFFTDLDDSTLDNRLQKIKRWRILRNISYRGGKPPGG